MRYRQRWARNAGQVAHPWEAMSADHAGDGHDWPTEEPRDDKVSWTSTRLLSRRLEEQIPVRVCASPLKLVLQ